MQQTITRISLFISITSRFALTLQLSYCDNPAVTTLRRLFGYTEGEFTMTNALNQPVFRTVGGNSRSGRKPVQTRRDHADFAQTVTEVWN